MKDRETRPFKTMIGLLWVAALLIPLLHIFRIYGVLSDATFGGVVMIFSLVFIIFFCTLYFYAIKRSGEKIKLAFSIEKSKKQVNDFLESSHRKLSWLVADNYFVALSLIALAFFLLNGSYTFPIIVEKTGGMMIDRGMLFGAFALFLLGLWAIAMGRWKESGGLFVFVKKHKKVFTILGIILTILTILAFLIFPTINLILDFIKLRNLK